MSAHTLTNGPWRVRVPASDSLQPFAVLGPPHPVDGGDYAPLASDIRSGADACCMGASREMLDALEGLIQHFGQRFKVQRDYHKMVAWEAARTAIRKARGES